MLQPVLDFADESIRRSDFLRWSAYIPRFAQRGCNGLVLGMAMLNHLFDVVADCFFAAACFQWHDLLAAFLRGCCGLSLLFFFVATESSSVTADGDIESILGSNFGGLHVFLLG